MYTIIVGVDGSVPSRAAIHWALDQADLFNAGVVLAHVVDDEAGLVGATFVEELGAAAPAFLDGELKYARSVAPSAVVGVRLLEGSPMWELAQLSASDTLLVVGTHKSGFHYGRAFGSRSLQLANLADGAVAVIPVSTVRVRRGIVVGVDETDAGLEALDLAADLAAAKSAELTLVRASRTTIPSGLEDDERQAWQLQRDDIARESLRVAGDRVRMRQPALTVRSHVVRRAPGEALNDLSRPAELLIIGDSRRPGSQPGTLGSVAYDVLLNLTSPAIVVHAPRQAAATEPSLGPSAGVSANAVSSQTKRESDSVREAR
jgi:nucleotide-binding universal stress UspA family protein